MLKNTLTYGNYRFGIVDNDDLKKDIFRMRYEIYVEEFGFEAQEDHPDGLETDEYEEASIHFACLNDTDSVVGTIRLVLDSDKGFPIEHAVNTTFIGEKPDRSKMAEISRLTVSRNLRRRKVDGMYGLEAYLKKKEGGVLPNDGSLPEEMRGRKGPVIVLGLYQVMYQESKRRRLSHWYMITEQKLFFALRKYGVLFHKIGEPVQYHGKRTPYLGIIEEIEKDLIKNNPNMLKIMLTGLAPEYYPSNFPAEPAKP